MGVKNKKAQSLSSSKHNAFVGSLCYILPFVFLSVNFVLMINEKGLPRAQGYYMTHYLYTYDRGFISRGFVGEVISWFVDTVTDDFLSAVLVTFQVLLIISASLVIGKFLNKVKDDEVWFKPMAVMMTAICLFPSFFRMYSVDPKLDKLLWALALLAVFFADMKYGVWLTIPLCLLATLVNPVFLITSMLLVSLILLQEFQSSGKSLKNGVVCAIAYSSMIALGLYALFTQNDVEFETVREFVDFFFSRYEGTELEYISYESYETLWVPDFFVHGVDDFWNKVFTVAESAFFNFHQGLYSILCLLFVYTPAYIILGKFWYRCSKKETDKFQKFIFFLCSIVLIPSIPAILVVWEGPKYFSNSFRIQLFLIAYYITKRHPSVLETFTEMLDFAKKNILITAIMFLYALVVLV